MVVSSSGASLVVWPFTLAAGEFAGVLERMAHAVCQPSRLELSDGMASAAAEAAIRVLPTRIRGAGEAKAAVLWMARRGFGDAVRREGESGRGDWPL